MYDGGGGRVAAQRGQFDCSGQSAGRRELVEQPGYLGRGVRGVLVVVGRPPQQWQVAGLPVTGA